MIEKLYRVTRKRPCRICGKPDWCGFSPHVAICMRVTSSEEARNGGWVHRLSVFVPPPSRPAIPDPVIDLNRVWQRAHERTDLFRVDRLGMELGVDTDALKVIGCAWMPEYGAFAFPMRDSFRNLIGIRLRSESGKKWAVKGSRQGLFLPVEYPFCVDDATLYIVEGPTDLAAALTLGLHAIARPACLGQEEMIVKAARAFRVSRVVIVTDNDQPDQMGRRAGLSGAERLQKALPVKNCIWLPPTKDIREFLLAGGNSMLIEAMVKDLVWANPQRQAA